MSREFAQKEPVDASRAREIITAFANPNDTLELMGFLEACDVPKVVLNDPMVQQKIQELIIDLLEPYEGETPDEETQEIVDYLQKVFPLIRQ